MNKSITTFAAIALTPAAALAIGEGEFDVFISSIGSSQIVTGGVTEDSEGALEFEPGKRIFETAFENDGVGNLVAEEPGFFANSLDAGAAIGFNVLVGIRAWNGASFDAAGVESMLISENFGGISPPEITTGTGFTAGFDFAVADGTGSFDDHPWFVMPDTTTGIKLLELEVTAPNGATSQPLFFLFDAGGANGGEVALEAAEDYVANVILPAPAAGALALFAGGLTLSRRRRA
jgi:hypothetical protein